MPAALIPLIIAIVQEAIKYVPTLAADIAALLSKNDATAADWAALQAKYAGKTYADYVPDSALTPPAK